MRSAALLILFLDLVVIADVSFQCADRLRAESRQHANTAVERHVEDWETATSIAVGVGLVGLGWLAVMSATRVSRIGQFALLAARIGTIGSILCGIGLAFGVGVLFLAFRDGGTDGRYEWEARWLIGSALGGIAGTVIGGGLGIVRHILPRPPTKVIKPN